MTTTARHVSHLSVPGTSILWEHMLGSPIAHSYQQPVYRRPRTVKHKMAILQEKAALTSLEAILELKQNLALVATGKASILQAGNCAEDMDGHDPKTAAQNMCDFVEQMRDLGQLRENETGAPVIFLGRVAGQLAKPRTQAYETIQGRDVPVYRGDMINGRDIHDRWAAADRLLRAHRFSHEMADLLAHENSKTHDTFKKVHASHEALSLPYEYGLLRSEKDVTYAGSAPYVWIGDRTRQLDGPHIAFARMIANPVGVKINANVKPDELNQLIDAINPYEEPGKLTIVFRMGAKNVDNKLGDLLNVVSHKNGVIAQCDPVHGNTEVDPATGKKTRHMRNVLDEASVFATLCQMTGVHNGGLHIETSTEDVTECLGAGVHHLEANYQSLCDPRLNPEQARIVVASSAQRLRMVA